MGYPIRTNKVRFSVDYAKLESLYDFFCVRTTEKYFSQSATILDLGIDEKSVCSIKYESGNTFYIMLHKSPDNHTKLKSALEQYESADKLSFVAVSAEELSANILLQLLLNALLWTDNQLLSFNNLTGRLYCFNSGNIKHGRSGEQNIIKQIKSLEVSVDKNLCLQLNVRTFTNVKFKSKIKFGKRKFEEYAQYVISNKNTLKRKTKTDDLADTFILRQFSDKKSELPFLCLSDIDAFNASKMGILVVVLKLFTKKYGDFASVDFETIDSYTGIDHKKRDDKTYKGIVAEILKKADIRIIDKVNSDASAILISNIQEIFNREYGVQIPLRKQVSKTAMNIAVIHNKDWYDGQEDEHATTNLYVLQHITIEDFLNKGEFAVNTIVNELIIKQNLQAGKLSIFDWESQEFTHDWVFGIKSEIDDEVRYFFMTIHSDGSFDFTEKKFDLFSIEEYCKYSLILSDKETKGVVVNADGQINVIKETGWFTIPQIEQIQAHLQEGDNRLRSKAKEDELLYSCLDIKYMPVTDKSAYYLVGTIGSGMQAKISDSCSIRRIEADGDSPLFFEQLLQLMDITFVRNGQLTVVPFPFKFLREWIEENLGVISVLK